MKRKKINKLKFIRNIIIGIVSLLVVAFIINIAPGYKRDKYTNVTNLIIDEENKTEELKHEIYINNNGTVYISEEDIRNLFDPNIYYDAKYNQIITTSDTKVANIVINEKKMIINSSSNPLLDSIIKIDDNIYLPISDMSIIYNIKVDYIKNTNRVVIDKLNRGMIKAIAIKDTDIKFKPRGLSKNVGTLKQGETVNCFYTTSKGWRQIRTLDGTIGYVKANKVGDEYIVRQDMKAREPAIKISRDNYNLKEFEIATNTETKKVTLKNIFNITSENIEVSGENYNEELNNKIWASVTNKTIQEQTNEILQDYKSRTNLIDLIVEKAIENDIKGISIDFTGIENTDSMIRFMIELTPKLREIGISTCIVLNQNIEEQDYINIVDYIVE